MTKWGPSFQTPSPDRLHRTLDLRQIAQRGVAAIAYEHVRLWLRILICCIRIHHLSCWLLRTLHRWHLLLKTLRPLLVRLRRHLLGPRVVLLLRHLLVRLLISLLVLLRELLAIPPVTASADMDIPVGTADSPFAGHSVPPSPAALLLHPDPPAAWSLACLAASTSMSPGALV